MGLFIDPLADLFLQAGKNTPPFVLEEHNGITVVRDDLFPGGTKARLLVALFSRYSEVVYASPAQGGAQVALAAAAKVAGGKATIFTATRAEPHPRTAQAKAMGANVVWVRPGYLNVVQARAKAYAEENGSKCLLAPFGMAWPGFAAGLAEGMRRHIAARPDDIWCAAGSGTLGTALGRAFPKSRVNLVSVGKELGPDIKGIVHKSGMLYEFKDTGPCPFPADGYYEVKAWHACLARQVPGEKLFWNVLG